MCSSGGRDDGGSREVVTARGVAGDGRVRAPIGDGLLVGAAPARHTQRPRLGPLLSFAPSSSSQTDKMLGFLVNSALKSSFVYDSRC